MQDIIRSEGIVTAQIEWDDGSTEERVFHNRVLRSGRIALAKALGNSFGSAYEFFVTGMAFGSGGTTGGSPRYVDDTRTGLFGPTVITKPVISSINPDTPMRVVFTSVLAFDDAVGNTINEMALKMRNGEFYSMATFGDISKTSAMQIVWNWAISYL